MASQLRKEYSSSTTGDEVVKTFADNVEGRTFLVTGASSGSVGAEFALSLCRYGSPAVIVLLGRDQSKISPVVSEINKLNPSVEVFYIPLDLSSEVSIRTAANEIMSNTKIEKINVSLNSAGVMACPYSQVKKWKDKDGRFLELQFATNHIGHFLLTNLLMPKIRNAGPRTRIVSVSSSGHRFNGVHFDDVGYSNGKDYQSWDAYAQSKSANILMTTYLASHIPHDEVVSLSIHPGAIPTNLGRHMTDDTRAVVLSKFSSIPNMEPFVQKNLQEGCSTALVAALDPELNAYSGSYLHDCKRMQAAEHATNQTFAELLWRMSEEIVGEKFML